MLFSNCPDSYKISQFATYLHFHWHLNGEKNIFEQSTFNIYIRNTCAIIKHYVDEFYNTLFKFNKTDIMPTKDIVFTFISSSNYDMWNSLPRFYLTKPT